MAWVASVSNLARVNQTGKERLRCYYITFLEKHHGEKYLLTASDTAHPRR